MVRNNLYILLTVVLFNNCANSQKKEPCIDDSTFKLIDTTAFYLMDEIKHPNFINDNNLKSTKRGIKFYKNGQVKEFNDYPNDKNAEGTYCINSIKAEMKLYYKHVQGDFWSWRKLEFKNDTIISYVQPSPQTKGFYTIYIKRK